VSFTIEGHQCIAIAADRVLYVFGFSCLLFGAEAEKSNVI